jgi:uncharacterized protein YecT (DUF1311 family)
LIRVTLVLVLSALLAPPVLAQTDKPNARDSAAIQDCVKTKGGHGWKWEQCIGTIAESCAKDEVSMAPSEVMACYDRELAVWDDILNESYRRLRKALDADQQRKLRDMQRAWIASRDKTCHFMWDYFQGSMANPMIAACVTRETGRRALFLLGFANDADGK